LYRWQANIRNNKWKRHITELKLQKNKKRALMERLPELDCEVKKGIDAISEEMKRFKQVKKDLMKAADDLGAEQRRQLQKDSKNMHSAVSLVSFEKVIYQSVRTLESVLSHMVHTVGAQDPFVLLKHSPYNLDTSFTKIDELKEKALLDGIVLKKQIAAVEKKGNESIASHVGNPTPRSQQEVSENTAKFG